MMKILIGYDGSSYADAAVDDLLQAGLPQSEIDATVLTIADLWMPPLPLVSIDRVASQPDKQIQRRIDELRKNSEKSLDVARSLAEDAGGRIRQMFPLWSVNSQTCYGSPAFELIKKADEICPDLLIVGSHGQTALGRLFLGSVSQKTLHESHCSVRIVRKRIRKTGEPLRILIAFDGSECAVNAIKEVAARSWAKETEFRIITADDDVFNRPRISLIDSMAEGEEDSVEAKQWIRKMVETPKQILESAGLNVSHRIRWGSAREIVLNEAESWKADCIFVGARGLGYFKRFLVGSVSSAVAARAKCSVEVVRNLVTP